MIIGICGGTGSGKTTVANRILEAVSQAEADIKAGKIAAVTLDRMTFTATSQPKGKPEKVTGDLANLAAQDVAIVLVLEDRSRLDNR